ncbi:MAG: hypothetical protein ACREL1_08755 [bacterium]
MKSSAISRTRKIIDFFTPASHEKLCLGISLGRSGLEIVETNLEDGNYRVESVESRALAEPLWSGVPSYNAASELTAILKPYARKREYRVCQVSLPDPLASWEVFELEQVPARGAATDEFLNWRFNPDAASLPELCFASQRLGEEKGKKLLLGVGLDRAWTRWVGQALEGAGLQASVTDIAFRFRFNLFQTALGSASGALVSLERDYWSLALWDESKRPRLLRAKWWKGPVESGDKPALDQILLEVERTIRSYVHSGTDRSVENLFLSAPQDWLTPALKKFKEHTGGLAVGVPLDPYFTFPEKFEGSPSAAATAARP